MHISLGIYFAVEENPAKLQPLVRIVLDWKQKTFMPLWLLSGSWANSHLLRVSLQSRFHDNDKGNDKLKPGLCTDLLAFPLQMRKTSENLSYNIGSLMKAVLRVIASNGLLVSKWHRYDSIACHGGRKKEKGMDKIVTGKSQPAGSEALETRHCL